MKLFNYLIILLFISVLPVSLFAKNWNLSLEQIHKVFIENIGQVENFGEEVDTVNSNIKCDAGCGAGQSCSAQIPCARVVKLPFFWFMQLIASFVFVALIYVF